jgi:hypothetical protein
MSLVSAGMGVSIGPASVAKLVASVVIRPLPKLFTNVHLVQSSVRENPVSAHFVKMF